MTPQQESELILAACEVRKRAYAKYSNFFVGAALLTNDGHMFAGCNVENISYGLTNCAERTAIFSAVAAGYREFSAVAIATSGGVPPCGACRQVLAEFNPDMLVVMVDVNRPNQVQRHRLSELLPSCFDKLG